MSFSIAAHEKKMKFLNWIWEMNALLRVMMMRLGSTCMSDKTSQQIGSKFKHLTFEQMVNLSLLFKQCSNKKYLTRIVFNCYS